MTVRSYMQDHIVLLDGGMGTLLQAEGLAAGEHPERWNITHADVLQRIHRAYAEAGANVLTANTFGANSLTFSMDELDRIVCAAVGNVRAAQTAAGDRPCFAALDIGPTGRLLKPYGDFDFEEAVAVFADTVRLGVKYGVDLILVETMNDSYETKAAVLAAKENSDLPIIVTNAYGADGKLMTGATPAAMVAMLEGLGVDALGANCSLGPQQLIPVVDELLAVASIPVVVQPNAGLPTVCNGETVFDVSAETFAATVGEMARRGVRGVGGCCGTTPAYIAALTQALKDVKPLPLTDKLRSCVSSYTQAVCFGDNPVLIGERINPTGKKRFKQALVEHDMAYILQEGVAQQERGVHILDVNVGLPEIDEPALLTETVCELQAIIDLPLQLDTADPQALERALRRYNGKPLINSVNGKADSMAAVFPLVKKYGGMVVALTLDEDGIPSMVEGRVAIAKRIVATAARYGIDKKELLFDTLAMTVSADTAAAQVTLGALYRIREELGCHTSLGVSNVSFGLPHRELVNSAFFAAALERGLSAAIMNPYAVGMLDVYYTHCMLHNLDANCAAYMAYAASRVDTPVSGTTPVAAPTEAADVSPLQYAIMKGLKDVAATETDALLAQTAPLELVQQEIIPALDTVGRGFEQKRVYLPQLLMSAEAAKSAFERIKCALLADGGVSATKGPVVLATVEGDIHDIGKNIVKLLLENYGFAVIDLGKDVSPAAVLVAVKTHKAPLVGLSALMTTTVGAMEETIRLLKAEAPTCRVVVGGAVLTAEYAASIGADAYAKDAMETVRYADSLVKG